MREKQRLDLLSSTVCEHIASFAATFDRSSTFPLSPVVRLFGRRRPPPQSLSHMERGSMAYTGLSGLASCILPPLQRPDSDVIDLWSNSGAELTTFEKEWESLGGMQPRIKSPVHRNGTAWA